MTSDQAKIALIMAFVEYMASTTGASQPAAAALFKFVATACVVVAFLEK